MPLENVAEGIIPQFIITMSFILAVTQFDTIAEVEDDTEEAPVETDPISSMCQQLSQELTALSNNSKYDLQQETVSKEEAEQQVRIDQDFQMFFYNL